LIKDLRENMGIFCSIVVYPVVPKGQIMLRIIPTSAHSLEDVEYTMNQFEVVQKDWLMASIKHKLSSLNQY
jgi:glycine C-acetyltransferase